MGNPDPDPRPNAHLLPHPSPTPPQVTQEGQEVKLEAPTTLDRDQGDEMTPRHAFNPKDAALDAITAASLHSLSSSSEEEDERELEIELVTPDRVWVLRGPGKEVEEWAEQFEHHVPYKGGWRSQTEARLGDRDAGRHAEAYPHPQPWPELSGRLGLALPSLNERNAVRRVQDFLPDPRLTLTLTLGEAGAGLFV